MSRPQEGLAESVQQLLRAYRRRLTLRTGVTGLLGVGCLGALLWRCSGSAMPRAGLMAVGGVGLLVVGGWAWSRIRRERLAATHLPLDLDRALGLEARLLTAAELAQESNPPALYPVLLEETRQAIASASSRLPRVMDRWTALSTAVLLMLLVYPRAVTPLTRLAKFTPPPPQPQAPSPQPPEPQPSGASSPQEPQSQEGSAAQQRQADQGRNQSASTGQSGEQQRGDSRAQGQQGGTSPQPSSPQGSRGDRDRSQAQRQNGQTDQQTQRRTSAADSSRRGSNQQGSNQPTGPSQAASTSAQHSGTGRQQTAQAPAPGAQVPMSGGQSPMDQRAQDALKGEIKQLLTQLSDELQSLQARVAEQPLDRPHPPPGTSTDPQLYDDADLSPQADASQRRLPVQLRVDQQEVASRRPGGGVGEPSDEVGEASPQQLEEDAQLSADALEAEAITRHAIPPEYQPVFERLSSQPEESLGP